MSTLTKDDKYYYWPKGLVAPIPSGAGGRDGGQSHFSTSEFSCKCDSATCVDQRLSIELALRLEHLRIAGNSGIKIHSGFRCLGKQAALKAAGYETATGVSQHTLGNAADISSANIAELLTLAKSRFKSIGAALTFLHVDTRDDKIRFWEYKTM